MKEDKNTVPIIIKQNYFRYVGNNVRFYAETWTRKRYNSAMLYAVYFWDGNHEYVTMLNDFSPELKKRVHNDLMRKLGYQELVDIL